MSLSPAAILYDSGGTEKATSGNPVRTDPTGTTTQPVSGSVTANIGTVGTLATAANQTTLGNQTSKINDGTNTSAVKAASTAAVAADPALVVAISPNNTVGVSGTVTANIGTSGSLALDATLTGGTQRSRITDGTNVANVKAASTAAVAADPALVVAISPNNSVAVTAASLPLPSGAATSANQTTLGSQTTKVNDGTNTATVKAASTAAVAADTALVVAISPNNSLTVSNPSVGSTGSAPPASATLSGGSVTTAAPSYTTGQMSALSLTTAGGLRVDATGTVTANIGTSGSLALDATLTGGTQKAIASGAAKGATAAGDATTTNQSADRQALDVQIRTSAGVVVDTFGGGTQFADGTARGTATGTLMMVDDGTDIQSASGDTGGRLNVNAQGSKTNNNAAPGTTNIGVLPAVANAAAPSWTEGNQVAASVLLNGAMRTDNTSWLGSTAPTVGQKTMANSLPVAIASDQGAVTTAGGKTNNNAAPGATNLGTFPALANAANPSWTEGNQVAASVSLNGHLRVREQTAPTGTSTNVASSATNVTLLASNTARTGATIFNDSTQNLFMKLGATASLTSFTTRLVPNAYYEVPFGYTGIIDGIWNTANGNARVTELT